MTRDRIAFALAHLLPARLVYWAGIRMLAHATRVHADRTPDELDVFDVLEAWHRDVLAGPPTTRPLGRAHFERQP